MRDGKDSTKIAFVLQGGARAEEQMRYLACLHVPEGMTVDVVTVGGAGDAWCDVCHSAQAASDAKYKVYLAPDAVLLYEPFLDYILRIFRTSPKIGLLGVLGAQQLRTDGIFAHALGIVGNVMYRTGEPLRGEAVQGAFASVSVLAGGVLATQRDVPWPEEFYQDADMLSMAVTIRCRGAGIRAAVPAQTEAWLLRDASSVPTEADQQTFLDTYSRELYPLVSVVIPTYERPDYFREALASVVQQTYRNLDIFVTDNSHDEATKRVYETEFANDPRITYEHHPEFDAQGNWKRAIDYDNPEAPYVNWLMDDDLFFPEKIARMIDCFFECADVTLVTSSRQLIDTQGRVLPEQPWSKPFVSELSVLDGRETGRYILRNMKNVLGEPTTALVKKSAMHHHRLGWSGKEGKYLISDFPTWLCVLSKGNCVYFPEPLSAFRIHDGQQQRSLKTQAACTIGWALALKEAIDRGVFFYDLADRRYAILKWLLDTTSGLMHFSEDVWARPYVKDINTIYRAVAAAMESGGPIAFDIDTGA